MEVAASAPVVTGWKYRRWLPYWAVLQTDLRQTIRSWAYRLWVFAGILAGLGYVLYRYGIYREAGIVQSASAHTSDLLRWIILGSLALIVVLTVSSIASERGTVADSVLSRGISRYQYFLAKWHARSAVVVLTFSLMGGLILLASYTLLSEDLSLVGSFVALATTGVILIAIVSCGVMLSALTSSTVLGISILWVCLYGCGFLMTLLPPTYPSPERSISRLPHVLRGHFNLTDLAELAAACGILSFATAMIGMIAFSRKDV